MVSALKPPIAVALALLTLGCVATHHPTTPSALGIARSSDALLAVLDRPGPITLDSIDSAEWEVPLSGVLNLDHPKAKAAGLVDRAEPIVIRFHVIEHPERGMFIVDTGVERAVHDPDRAAVRGMAASYMAIQEKLVVRKDLATFLDEHGSLAGVFLTHLHVDHVMGVPDVPAATPIYAGPGETSPRSLQNLVLRPNLERLLEGHEPIREWKFAADPAGRFAGLLDVFGDGALWAIWVPGHTPGSTAYLVRTTRGPVLLTGDASHTRWGWENGVEPGTYSYDREQAAASFQKLRAFADAHPNIEVRVGHQH
jgi:glyoxylase-like metal-dependent hydrolase (beta-lactamase superfamily II)